MQVETGRSLIQDGLPGQRPSRGLDAVVLLVVRLAVGIAAIVTGVRIQRDHAAYVRAADAWGIPVDPAPVLWAVIVVLVLFGVVCAVGLAPRLAAILILIAALCIVATAGRVDGGLALFGGAALALGALVIVARGGGAAQLLDRVDP